MTKYLQIYVKPNSNCEGLPLTDFERLSNIWTAPSIMLPFGDPPKKRRVVGWSSLFGGSSCRVELAKVKAPDGTIGYLVSGGDWGVRILARDEYPQTCGNLPPGYGQPIVWIDDPNDIPESILNQLKPITKG